MRKCHSFIQRRAASSLRLVIRRPGQERRKPRAQRFQPRPRLEETAADHRVEHLRIASQVLRQRRRGGGDVDDQVDELRIGAEQREHLHARGQAGKEGVELFQRLLRFGGLLQAGQDLGAQALEDLHRARRAQGWIAVPAFDDGPGLGRHFRCRAGGVGGKEAFGQPVHLGQPIGKRLAQGFGLGAHEGGQPVEALRVARQVVGLGVGDHLQAVLDLAVVAVGGGEGLRPSPARPSPFRPAAPARRACRAPAATGRGRRR